MSEQKGKNAPIENESQVDEMDELVPQPTADLDSELATAGDDFEMITLYLTYAKFGQTMRLGAHPRSPLAVFTKGKLDIERTPNNENRIRMLMNQYQCTTNFDKAKASFKEYLESLPENDPKRAVLAKL